MTTKANIAPMTTIGGESGVKCHVVMLHPYNNESALLVATCFCNDRHISLETAEANAILFSQAPAMAFFIHRLASLGDYLSPEMQASAVELLRRAGIEINFVSTKFRIVRDENGNIAYEEKE